MSTTITLDAAGRFVLPKAIRDRLHLRAGARLRADIVADKIELTPEPEDGAKLVRKGKMLVITGARAADVVESIRADREERMDHLARGLRSR